MVFSSLHEEVIQRKNDLIMSFSKFLTLEGHSATTPLNDPSCTVLNSSTHKISTSNMHLLLLGLLNSFDFSFMDMNRVSSFDSLNSSE